MSSYTKAKIIIEHNNQTDSQAYLEINLKISQVFLLNNNVQQAVLHAKLALNLAQNLNIKEQYLLAAQVLSRCYEISDNWEEYSLLVKQLISTLSLFSYSLQPFQSLLKVIFLPALRTVIHRSKETAYSLQNMLKTLP